MKKETDTEFLARLVTNGFGEVNTRFDGIDIRLDGIDNRLLSLEKIQSQTLSRLDSIERKQDGTLLSLDETVHRSEFAQLVQRVEILEK
ncbi:MAG: hypothetical protein Q8L37_02945 [Candidatus Gottesmanbacteria bacterium]|nr:hypothetical protein [Candidatus Gottesmanbacteria bacterium]